MFRIFSIFLLIAIGSVIVGCTPKTNTSNIKQDPHMLSGVWQVEDIDQGGIIDFAMVSLQFEEENRIVGTTGCNRFFGTADTLDGAFVASQVATTLRACPPAVLEQEQRFLAALNDATHYEIKENTWLIIYDAADKPRLTLIKMNHQPELDNTKADQSKKK